MTFLPPLHPIPFLVSQLRDAAKWYNPEIDEIADGVFDQAADRLEELAAEVERLRKASPPGCICPPGAEVGCCAINCGRRGFSFVAR